MTEMTDQNEEKATQENPLFKPEIWEIINSKYNWAAMDEDGLIYFYREKPFCHTDGFWVTREDDWIGDDNQLICTNVKPRQWKSSLTKRPSVEN